MKIKICAIPVFWCQGIPCGICKFDNCKHMLARQKGTPQGNAVTNRISVIVSQINHILFRCRFTLYPKIARTYLFYVSFGVVSGKYSLQASCYKVSWAIVEVVWDLFTVCFILPTKAVVFLCV